MKILVLEDDCTKDRMPQFRQRVIELNSMYKVDVVMVHVETAKDCISELEKITNKNEAFSVIFLDHDLGGEVYVDTDREDTGSEVARWINKNPEKIYDAFVITHTFNPSGAKNIVDLIPGCIYIPGIWMKDKFHKIVQVS